MNVSFIKATIHNLGVAQTVRRQRIEWNVDASLVEVARDVLPKIGELQGRAGVVREPLALRVAVATQIQNEPPDRVGGIAAIADHVVPGAVAIDGLVLAERNEQVAERLDGDIAG